LPLIEGTAKAKKVSYGSNFQTTVVSQVKTAKTEGVTLPNGTKVFPHEVWFVTSTPFPSNKRLLVADTLKKLESENIKFIAGEELCQLLIETMPDLVTKLFAFTNSNVLSIISDFSKHADGVAFNLDPRKKPRTSTSLQHQQFPVKF